MSHGGNYSVSAAGNNFDWRINVQFIRNRVRAVGDIDANRFNDLSISYEDAGSVSVFFGGSDNLGAVIDSSALPKKFALHMQDSSINSTAIITSVKIGDIDNDGIDGNG